jgi:DNA polymerase elongation subunit (family B)
MPTLHGWIFDAYLIPEGVALWVIDERGRMHQRVDGWQPRLFVGPSPLLDKHLAQNRVPVTTRMTCRKDLFSGTSLAVVEIRVRNPLQYNRFVAGLEAIEGLRLFNCDIHLVQAYHYERGHFPLAKCRFESDESGRLTHYELQDSPWDLDYTLPPLRYARLGLDHRTTDPNHGRTLPLRLTLGDNPQVDTTYVLESPEPHELLETLNRHIAQYDPDVILSEWGDSYLFPRLTLLSQKAGVPLKLSRDAQRGIEGFAGRSYFTYGRTIYQGGAQYLFGRWHLDIQNSFTLRECKLDGLLEIARIAKIPVQRAARCTIGTSLSSMQLDVADQDGILVPLHKQQTEDFREGLDFIAADKGGIVYAPELGWHEGVGELDFVSMYPAIMAHYNVSPETVNCACCTPSRSAEEGYLAPTNAGSPDADNKAPEIGHHLCTRRRGLVPRVLEKIIDKRAQYKRLSKTTADPNRRESYKRRYTAHKWALVTCFGYLGYKNARFGKIEAHECVSAYGREVLLTAKDIAEAEGFHMLHAIVDSMWLKKPGAGPKEYLALAEKISLATGFDILVEGFYKWLSFCSSKADAQTGVPNRYFGCFSTGELKLRGIEIRRHDTPVLFKRFQEELLEVLRQASGIAACRDSLAHLEDIYLDYQDQIKTGGISAVDLAFSCHLTRRPEDYVHDTASAIAAQQLAAAGIELHIGEKIQYIISSSGDKVKDWRVTPLALIADQFEYDPKKYLELLGRAYNTITEGLL